MNPFVSNHPAYRMAMGLPNAAVPPLEALRGADEDGRIPGGFHLDLHQTVDSMLAPPRQPPTLAEAFEKIFAAIISKPEDATPEAQQVMQYFLDGQARLAALLDARKQTKKTTLQEQHAKIYAECRAAFDQRNSLQLRSGAQAARISTMEERCSQARAELNSVLARRPQRGEFPWKSEIKTWEQEVNTAKDKLTQLEGECAAEQRMKIQIDAELSEAESALRELQPLEEDLRCQITGEERRFLGVELKQD